MTKKSKDAESATTETTDAAKTDTETTTAEVVAPPPAQDPKIATRARDLYAVYCASSDGKNFQGNPCPDWDALPEAVRGHWYTVALRAWSLEVRACTDSERHTHYLGKEDLIPPNTSVLGHLPDAPHALAVWQAYSGTPIG